MSRKGRKVVRIILLATRSGLSTIPQSPQLLLLAGSAVQEGVRLTSVCETNAWVWAVAGRPGHDELVVGCDGGSIRMHKLKFQHITAIHKVSDRACSLQLTNTSFFLALAACLGRLSVIFL